MKFLKKRVFLFLIVFAPFFQLSLGQDISSTESLKTARWLHQSQLLKDGRVIAFGGDDCTYENPEIFNSAEIYDPNFSTWSYTGTMNEKRKRFSSVLLNNGKVLAIGGSDNINELKSSCEIYDPATGLWTYTGSLNSPRGESSVVKLLDGRILIVGASLDSTSEIYNPATEAWTYGAKLWKDLWVGASMVVLEDGHVLLTGGQSWMGIKDAGIYDPLENKWTKLSQGMNEKRESHYSVLLNDGKVMIVGGESSDNWYTGYSHELFDPNTNSFTRLTNSTEINNHPVPILLDDDNVLVFGFGDFFNLLDTKIIEVYNVSTNSWHSDIYHSIGSIGYTAHKLKNGNILIIGGTYTTYNGASRYCYIITPKNIISGCSALPLNLVVTGSSACFGANGTVTLSNSQTGVTYRPYINGLAVAPEKPGGGNITFSISTNKLQIGNNTIMIQAKKPGCEKTMLNNTAFINVYQAISQPVINSGILTICKGENTILAGPNGYSEYLWTNNSTTQNIQIDTSGKFVLKVRDITGCESELSEPVTVKVNSLPDVNAGNDQSTCISSNPFAIKDINPTGGNWIGTGISTDGIFDPSITGLGPYELIYKVEENNCNNTDTIQIFVGTNAIPTISIQMISGTIPTNANNAITFKSSISNGGSDPQFQWLVNSIPSGSNLDQFTYSGWNDHDQVTCTLTSSEACALPAQASSSSITVSVYDAPKATAFSPGRNSSDSLVEASISIGFLQPLSTQTINSSSITISGNMRGILSNSLGVFSMNTINSFRFDPFLNFYPGEKISITLKKTIQNSIGTPMTKPFVYKFKSRPNFTSGNLDGYYYIFGQTEGRLVKDMNVGDYTGDGILDVAYITDYYVTISRLKENVEVGEYINSSGFANSRLFSGDFDQDGDLDVATSDETSTIIGYNNGYGTFPFENRVMLSKGTDNVIGGDLDGDGDIDLINTNRTIHGFNVFINNGTGNFNFTYSYPIQSSPVICSEYELEDFDNDGDLDLSIIGLNPYAPDSVYFYTNLGNATFTLQTVFETELNPSYTVAEDFNGDGNIDIAIVNFSSSNTTVHLNNGLMEFTKSATLTGISPLQHILSADFDGDGDMDIVISRANYGGIFVFPNKGDGTFEPIKSFSGSGIYSLASGDIDMDGDVDLLESGGTTIHALLNDGTIPKVLKPELSKTYFCAGATSDIVIVNCKGRFSFANNIYTVQLSSSKGEFNSPIDIGSIQTGETHTGLYVNFPANLTAGDYKIRIISSNPSLIGEEISIKIQNHPPNTPTIYGQSTTCLNQVQTYKIIPEMDTKYNWYIISGGSFFNSYTDSTSIYWETTGNHEVKVTASNGCGNGTAQVFPVNVSTTSATINTITGNTSVCPDKTEIYSVEHVNGEVRLWSVDGGTLINTSGDEVSVKWETPETLTNISVNSINICNSTTPANLQVTIHPKATIAGPISGNSTVMENSSEVYSTTNHVGSTFKWIISGGTGTSSTNSILINWASMETGTIKVVEINSNLCESDTLSLPITISHINHIKDKVEKNISIYPNPATGIFSITAENINLSETEIIISNSMGEYVFHDNADFNNICSSKKINISQYAKGIYTIKVIGTNFIINRKIIIN